MVELRGSLKKMRENKIFVLSGCSTDTIVQIFVQTLYDFEHEINTKKYEIKYKTIQNKLILIKIN